MHVPRIQHRFLSILLAKVPRRRQWSVRTPDDRLLGHTDKGGDAVAGRSGS
jgi:hypothetical protein